MKKGIIISLIILVLLVGCVSNLEEEDKQPISKGNFEIIEEEETTQSEQVTEQPMEEEAKIERPEPRTSTLDYECSYNKYNCADFKTQTEAQAVMIYCGNDDIHYLDGDDDGIACESLK